MDRLRYIQAVWCLLLILTGDSLGWASQQANQPVQDPSQLTSQAKAFEINGNNVQAFATYLKFPGGERFAVLIGKTDPTVYLAELDSIEAKTKDLLNPRLWLVRGDLQMQSGKNAEALACYRKFVAAISQTADQGWEQGWVPRVYYPVSPQFLALYNGTRGPSPYEPVEIYPSLPFHFGSGSQIDNWLIQRFLTLGAWEDAEQEFKRVWAIYQDASSNNQLSGLARQFALEYAFFLIKYRQPQRGLDLLLNVFLQLDLERNPAVDFSLQENNSRHKAQANGTKAPPSHSKEFRAILLRTNVFSGSEFIRLAYGQFQRNQQLPSLTLAIQRQIQHGRNQARWVLAHILQLEGKSDEALATELEYLRHAQFNALTITYRSGLTYERFNRLSESATAFEQTLTLPDQPIALPDQDGYQSGSLVFDLSRNRTLEFSIDQKSKVLKRLFEIYCVLGETEKALNAGLRRLELEPSSWRALMDDTEFEVLCNLFLLSGRQAQLTDWYRDHAHQFENYPTRKVRMSFILDDQDLFIQSLVSPTKPTKGNLNEWIKLLQSRKKKWLQPFLEAMAKADPTNEEVARALFTVNPNEPPPGSEAYWGKLFEQRSRLSDPELFFNQLSPTPQTIAMVEQILIENGKPVPGVAYGLMRMYEKTNQVDKMLALALNLARTWKLPEKRTWAEWSGSELVNPTLAIAIQHIRSPEDQKTLLQALEQTPWDKATTQLKRAIEGQDLTSPPAKPLPWHNIPNGIRLFGAHENVYSLCRDQKRVYVGYPWGVAVYNFSGHLITQIALESGAHHMTVIRGALWVGTELGVRRVDLKTLTVTGFRCDQEVLRSENQSNSNQKENRVLSLARQGNILWISTINSIRKYNTSTHELRVYQLPKKKYQSVWESTNWLVDGPYIWAQLDNLLISRYNPRTDRWESPQFPPYQSIQLIELIDGVVWCVLFEDEADRNGKLATIDPTTLKVTQFKTEPSPAYPNPSFEKFVSFYGRWQGKLVFTSSKNSPQIYDPVTRKLTCFIPSSPNTNSEAQQVQARTQYLQETIKSDLPKFFQTGQVYRNPDGGIVFYDNQYDSAGKLSLPFVSHKYFFLPLPNATAFFAGPASGSQTFPYSIDENSGSHSGYSTSGGQTGGVCLRLRDGTFRFLSPSIRRATIWGDTTYCAIPDLDHGRIWVGTSCGLTLLNQNLQVIGTVTTRDGLDSNLVKNGIGGPQIVLSHTESLSLFDPKTTIFTTLTKKDGLPPFKIDSLSIEDQKLKIQFAPRYLTRQHITITPTIYDFETHHLAPSIVNQSINAQFPQYLEKMPFMGGVIYGKQVINGNTFVFGSRGLMILPDEKLPSFQIPEWPVRFSPQGISWFDVDNQLPQLPALQPINSQPGNQPGKTRPDQPAGKTQTLSSNHPGQGHPSSGSGHTTSSQSKTLIGISRLQSPCDEPISLEYLRKLIENPFVIQQWNDQICIKALGKAVSTDPEMLELLLRSNPQTEHSLKDYKAFLKQLFAQSDNQVLPVLHQALNSTHLVVRRNAAYACAAVGDTSSIPLLIQTLDIESDFVRAGVIWALRELKAEQAAARLFNIYLEGNYSSSRFSLPLRTGEMNHLFEKHYRELKAPTLQLGSIQSDNPDQLDKDLISREYSWEDTFRSICAHCPQTYFQLEIKHGGYYGAIRAARCLENCSPSEIEQTKGILRPLAARGIIEAAVTLLILGDKNIEPTILTWLKEKRRTYADRNLILNELLMELRRVKDKSKLIFAREILTQYVNDPTIDYHTSGIIKGLIQP